jgi:hypothetical protein
MPWFQIPTSTQQLDQQSRPSPETQAGFSTPLKYPLDIKNSLSAKKLRKR